jgi:iron complex outermembrane receptor protein
MVRPKKKNLFGIIIQTCLIMLLCLPLKGQDSFFQDTVKINEVIISGKKTKEDLIGFKNIRVDSSIISNYNNRSLADMLVENTGIFIKSYGMGGSATPSFRGTGASQTQLQWNNININNPMLGQSDLSLVPAGLIDRVEISYGGSSISDGTGGIGGIINLENKPVWHNGAIVSLSPSVGSFGHYSGQLKVRAGNLNFQSSTKVYMSYAENDFEYINDVQSAEPVKETMRNNEAIHRGLMQEFYYRKSKDVLSARLWYQFADRNLPSSMLIPQSSSSEKQVDESIRTMVNYDGFLGYSEYFITGAYTLSKLKYTNELASIDSRNRSESLIFKTGMTNRIGDFVRSKFMLENEHVIVNTENYSEDNTERNVFSASAIAEVKSAGRIGATLLIKEILHGKSFLSPDFATGLQFRLTNAQEYYLKANFSRNSKLPSMNDLFWVPGGNPDLLSESTFTYELTYEMAQQISLPVMAKFDVSLYHNSISNMIQWRPGIYSYWSADNVKNVKTSGIESSTCFEYNENQLKSSLRISYIYTNARTVGSVVPNDESIGKQLIYIPEHQANGLLRFVFRGWYADWRTGYTGKRYTTSDNSSYLPGFILNSVSSGYLLDRGSRIFNLGITVDNLFNVTYQTIAYYPQPGRSFLVKLLIQIIK